jgi:hypothetical protein
MISRLHSQALIVSANVAHNIVVRISAIFCIAKSNYPLGMWVIGISKDRPRVAERKKSIVTLVE